MIHKPDKNSIRVGRHKRIRSKIHGTAERPRLNVYRSLGNIYAQVIDDDKGVTICSASTLEAEIKGKIKDEKKIAASKEVGLLVGRRAIEKGVKSVIFDRSGYVYTGRVAELATGAREAGLDF